MRVQVVGDELVEAFERMIGDVEEDGAVALFGAAADQLQRLLVALEQRRQQAGDKGLREHLGQRHLGEQRNEARNERRDPGWTR